jgi:hypothetical protein
MTDAWRQHVTFTSTNDAAEADFSRQRPIPDNLVPDLNDVNAFTSDKIAAKAAGLAVTARGAQVRPGPRVPAQRGEAGTHPKPRREAA